MVNDYKGKHIPKVKISFTNGIPRGYDNAKGFETELEGTYDVVLALLDEMRNAIVKFKRAEMGIAGYNEKIKYIVMVEGNKKYEIEAPQILDAWVEATRLFQKDEIHANNVKIYAEKFHESLQKIAEVAKECEEMHK